MIAAFCLAPAVWFGALGNAIPYIWVEREVDGKLRVYGNKPEDGKK